MQLDKFYGVGAFAAGLILTLFLAAYLTPRAWWKRPNARALLILVAGAWGFGSAILYFAHIKPAQAADAAPDYAVSLPPPPEAPQPPATGGPRANALIAGRPFQVHCYLNLRASAGVHAPRIAVVPIGATVTPTGARDGDWWQIKASVDGHDSVGWVSSLWLRRSGE